MASLSSNYNNYIKAQKLINASRFNEAFNLLKCQLFLFENLKKEIDILNQAEATYKYMLDYLSEGHSDPSQMDMIQQTRDILHRLNDIVYRETILKDSSDVYSSTRRMFILKKTTLNSLMEEYDSVTDELFKENPLNKDLVISERQSVLLNEIFNYVWTSFGISQNELDLLNNILESEKYPEYLKTLLISAIVLANLSYFDTNSFEVLLNHIDSIDSILIRARVITGVVLISLLNSKRVSENLNVRSRLILLSKDENVKKLIDEVLINIIRTFDTNRIDLKMRNEVIPGLMKINPEIIDRMKNMASDAENFLSDGNPEWEELIENSDIGNKLKEINDMQLDGADVMVTAFSNLKSFQFFNNISNWFLPFSPGYFEFSSLPISNDEKNRERLTTVMCDSDLHSFLLSLNTMPQERRNQTLSNMQNQMKEAFEALNSSIGESEEQKLIKKIRHFLQDLYRFFKYYRKKFDFKDPFSSPFLIENIEPLIPIFEIDSNTLKIIAEFYFKNKYYGEAVGYFEYINSKESEDFSLWEKIAFSYDRLKMYDKAVEWYLKADLVNPGNPWVEKKLAIALKNAGKEKESLHYYNKTLEREPDNFHLLMSMGQTLLSLEDYDESLKQFYHANYVNPGKKDVIRAIAWVELLKGNFEKAKSYYDKLISDPETDKTDFLNAAHLALAQQDFKRALNLYKLFVEKSDNQDITSLVLAFKDDVEVMKKLGIKTSDLRLIVDKIRYDLKK